MNGYGKDRKQEEMKFSLSSCLPFYSSVACFFVVCGLGFPLLFEFSIRTIQANFPFIQQAVQTHALGKDGLHGFLLESWPTILKVMSYAIYLKWFATKLVDDISRTRKIITLAENIPEAPHSFPLFGHALYLGFKCPWDILTEWALGSEGRKGLGYLFRIRLFGMRYLVISDPNLAKEVMRDRLSDFHKDTVSTMKPFLPLLGTGIVTSDGMSWFNQRKRIGSSLKIDAVKHVPALTITAVDHLSKQLRQAAALKEDFEMAEALRHMALQVISSALLDIPQEESDSHFAKMYLPIVTEMNKRVWNPFRSMAFFLPFWWRYQSTLKALNRYVSEIILSKWKMGGHDPRTSEAMKKVMDGATMGKPGSNNISKSDLQQMLSEVKTFILAGHETSASMISYTMIEIIRNKDLLQRVLDEGEEVWGGWKEGEELPDTSGLVFTEACLKEALRRHNAVPLLVKVTARDTVLGGYTVPKGTGILLLSKGVHMRPDLWANPEKFDPNRFIDPEKVIPYTFLSLSEGPRVCLGQNFALLESKIAVSLLFRRFRFELNMNVESALKCNPRIVPLTPNDGVRLRVYCRSDGTNDKNNEN